MRRLATAMLVLSVGCTTAVANEQVLPQGPRPTARHVALAPVVYQLSIDSAAEHLARVEMRISGYSQRPLDVAMPAWSPGAYRLLVPAKNVLQLKATASGQPLVVQQLDRSTWRIHKPPPDGEVVIRYRLYHPRPSVVRSHVARDYAGINGFDTFLYVVGNLGTPCRLSVQPHSDWRVVTGLGVEGALYSAPSYDVLIDSPLLIGTLRQRTFAVDGKEHHLVWSGDSDYDIDRLANDTRRIVEAVWPMFGAALPYRDYWFMWRFQQGAGGGLEHLNSTRINDGPAGYTDPDELDRHWRVTAHEYVHTWNVKRIRPPLLGPFDYTAEQHTPYLWFAEGFTSYFGDLALLRAGIWTRERYLHSLADAIYEHRSQPASEWMSAEQSSFTTWHKTEAGSLGRISYYNKGLLIAVLLEMAIREGSGGQYELEDLMKRLYQDFLRDGAAFEPGAIRRIAEQLAGRDLGPLFEQHVSGAAPMPFEEAFRTVGMTLKRKPGRPLAWLGVETRTGDKAEVTRVVHRSPAGVAGVRVGDQIIGLDKKQVSGDSLVRHVRSHRSGAAVEVTLLRAGRVIGLHVTLGERVVAHDPRERPSFRKVPFRIVPVREPGLKRVSERRKWLRTTGSVPRKPAPR